MFRMPPNPVRKARRTATALSVATFVGGCAALLGGTASLELDEKFNRWSMYEGDAGASHFSALRQIDKSNVNQLQVAWTYPIGDGSGAGMSPLIVDSVMYVIGRGGSVVALHGGTGRQLWQYTFPAGVSAGRDRGIMYWESPDRSDRRIFLSRQNRLYAVNAATGQLVSPFGENGSVDVREGITTRDRAAISANPSSPGTVFENLVILGSGTGEAYGSGPGDIRAFDARTGRLAWIFHTIPHPGEEGYESWEDPEAYKKIGGVNVWGGISVDEERGIVYLPIGSATYDFYGADRLGANLYANSLVALDARTGKKLWHFQTVHHDLWDYDLTATPTLMTVRQGGGTRDIVALATKQGFLFAFDRVTGEPLWPIEERPVPPSDMPGEKAWPTQPFPTWPKPFAVQSFTEADVNPYLEPAVQDSFRREIRAMNNKGLFTPPSTTPTMQMPGNSGGANWGSTAADPLTGTFYVLTKNLPTVLKLERIVPGQFGTGTSQAERGQFAYRQNCQQCHGPQLLGSPPNVPSLVGITNRSTPDEITAVIRDGRGLMPAHREMSPQEINAIITYLRAPQAVAPYVASESTMEGGGPLRFQTGYGYYSAPGGTWAIKPPYMTMTAYDMRTGEIRWQIPVGQVESLAARGITDTGAAQLRGGPSVTAGGLIFMATGTHMRAYDKDTGRELWSMAVPGGVEGIPAIYEVGGRQYVAIGSPGALPGAAAAGGAPPAPRAYTVFALPEKLVRR